MFNSQKILNFWLLVLPSAALFYAALFLTIHIRYPHGLGHHDLLLHLQDFTFIYLAWIVVFFSHRLFDLTILRRYVKLTFTLVSAMAVNLIVAVIYFYFQPDLVITPRRSLLLDVLLSFVFVLAWYLLVKYFLKSGRTEKIYLFSFDSELAELEQAIADHAFLGFRVLGHLNDQTLISWKPQGRISIILPPNLPSNPTTLAKFYELRRQGIVFYNYENFYETLLQRVYLSLVNEVWFLENLDYRSRALYGFGKRVIDLLAAVLMLIIFSITFPLIYLLLKLSSGASVFFIQERVGQNGQQFNVYKYRTMTGSITHTWTAANDPRITRFGKFLRKTRLDELPQFINLFRGNMSLVGPRPEQVGIVAELKAAIPFYDERHAVKPGVTGWAQLNIYAGNLEETKIKLSYDLYYIKHRSMLFDLEILIKTAYYILTGQGR